MASKLKMASHTCLRYTKSQQNSKILIYPKAESTCFGIFSYLRSIFRNIGNPFHDSGSTFLTKSPYFCTL